MNNGIMFLDLEVENNPYYGAIASPRHDDNYVVMIGQAIDYSTPYEGEVTHKYYKSKEEAKGWLEIPQDVGLLVAHNLSFEMDWIFEQNYEVIRDFINRGGMFWCTQLAEYRLTRQQHTYPALEETAMKYGGNAKLDLVALEWKQGKLTSEIDVDLLRDYLVGTDRMEGDIGNTRLAFYGQWVQAHERGMTKALLEQNYALIYNSVCMSVGMKVDMEVAQRNLTRLQGRIDEIEVEFKELLKQSGYTQEELDNFSFSTSSGDLSTVLFGGAYKYKGKVPSIDKEGNYRYEKQDAIVLPDGGYVQLDESYTVQDAEGHRLAGQFPRFKSGKRKGEIKVERIDSDEIKMINGEVGREVKGLVDLSTLPKEFTDTWLKEFTQNKTVKWEGKEYTLYSVSGDSVEALMTRKEVQELGGGVVKLLSERAILDKAVGSFYDKQAIRADGSLGKRSGMLQYVSDTGFIHPSLNITATETGRLSCTKPAMQTMPRDDRKGVMKSNVKEMFVSRFGDQGRIIEIDYSNLEGRALADLTGDENLARIILEDMDVLCLSVAEEYNKPYDWIYERAKGNPNHPEHDLWSQRRQDIKPAQYAYNYGASAHGIAYGTGWDLKQAEAFIERQKLRAPQAEVYFEGLTQRIEDSRKMRRHKLDDGTFDIYFEGYLKANSGFEYAYRTQKRKTWYNAQQMEVDEFKPTEIKNYIIQGDASLFVQVITGKLIKHYFKVDFYGKKCYPIMTVHDQVLLDAHVSVVEEVIRDTVKIMEDVPKYMSALGYNLKMPYPVEATVGDNWQDQVSLEEAGINLKGDLNE